MPDYKKMYFALFNQVTDAIEKLSVEVENLKRAQIQAEKLYISDDLYPKNDDRKEQ